MQTVSEKLKEMQKVLQPSPLSPTVDGRAQMSLLDIPFQMCCPVHRMLGAFFFLSSYSECDPGCYFLRSSYKVPVHFPRTLFPWPPHRECITHCSSVPLKKKKKLIKNTK